MLKKNTDIWMVVRYFPFGKWLLSVLLLKIEFALKNARGKKAL